ncbi:hypothetical protein HCN44_010547 [Aphidius gifuensis]|uniref:P/Homo B domain-containing protein n=1 Tax=Aphidius gifuensis TaxID=684658 RepID=A0A834XT63_APHGI|nr:hypothetical protein HCN44_010547 [Aphidius gifuensis]
MKNTYLNNETGLDEIDDNQGFEQTVKLNSSDKVLGFPDTYLWRRNNSQSRKRGNLNISIEKKSSKILWADQQKIFKRHKRDFVDKLESEKPLIRDKRLLDFPDNYNDIENNLNNEKMFNDELWNEEWYLQDTRGNKALPKLDLNVLPLYRAGVTGRGVNVAVLDDGLEHTHQDLINNYNSEISYDVNEGDMDPMPRYEQTGMNGHGTRCAGEIAMEANNHKCGVGVAFEASIGGIKLLDGIVNDRVEGEALGYRQDIIDIYTASWGPADDGKSLEAPGRLATEALERGIMKLCVIEFKMIVRVKLLGNMGWGQNDNCGCDGYVNSIYTIAVGSASQTGKFPWYGEQCTATMATTYSSGAYQDQMIATTDLKNKCTTRHTGTSASAPLAAGILALALQVNKELTWRDVQHLIVQTAEYSPLRNNPGWIKNSAGFFFNSRFGFGLMNAHALVLAANNWTRIQNKIVCHVKPEKELKYLTYGRPITLTFKVNNCPQGDVKVAYLEHVEIETSIKYTNRGSLKMHLTSAAGTRVQILYSRQLDDSNEGFNRWKFMSVATWGEKPLGTWSLKITDEIGPAWNNGSIENVTLILHGTSELPYYRKNGTRIYNDNYNRMRKTNRDEIIQTKNYGDEVNEDTKWNVILTNEINLYDKVKKVEKLIWLDWLKKVLFG